MLNKGDTQITLDIIRLPICSREHQKIYREGRNKEKKKKEEREKKRVKHLTNLGVFVLGKEDKTARSGSETIKYNSLQTRDLRNTEDVYFPSGPEFQKYMKLFAQNI